MSTAETICLIPTHELNCSTLLFHCTNQSTDLCDFELLGLRSAVGGQRKTKDLRKLAEQYWWIYQWYTSGYTSGIAKGAIPWATYGQPGQPWHTLPHSFQGRKSQVLPSEREGERNPKQRIAQDHPSWLAIVKNLIPLRSIAIFSTQKFSSIKNYIQAAPSLH